MPNLELQMNEPATDSQKECILDRILFGIHKDLYHPFERYLIALKLMTDMTKEDAFQLIRHSVSDEALRMELKSKGTLDELHKNRIENLRRIYEDEYQRFLEYESLDERDRPFDIYSYVDLKRRIFKLKV